jgi:uncharacterized membrane protein
MKPMLQRISEVNKRGGLSIKSRPMESMVRAEKIVDEATKEDVDKNAKELADKNAKELADKNAKESSDKSAESDKSDKILGMPKMVAIGLGVVLLAIGGFFAYKKFKKK